MEFYRYKERLFIKKRIDNVVFFVMIDAGLCDNEMEWDLAGNSNEAFFEFFADFERHPASVCKEHKLCNCETLHVLSSMMQMAKERNVTSL